jgi:hypothetical protein
MPPGRCQGTNDVSRKCSHTTAKGRPCNAWAVHGTDPPACAAHAGGGIRRGNPSRRTHGFYARTLGEDELADLIAFADEGSLDDEIACARILLRRLMQYLGIDGEEPPDPEDVQRLTSLALQATRTIARLIRDRHSLSDRAANRLVSAIEQALDELADEWGMEL